MQALGDEIEAVDDDTLRRAKLAKVRLEMIAVAITVLIYAQMLITDDVKYKLRHKLKRWRTAFFGPVALTVAQVEELERQVLIEAMRTVRYGE